MFKAHLRVDMFREGRRVNRYSFRFCLSLTAFFYCSTDKFLCYTLTTITYKEHCDVLTFEHLNHSDEIRSLLSNHNHLFRACSLSQCKGISKFEKLGNAFRPIIRNYKFIEYLFDKRADFFLFSLFHESITYVGIHFLSQLVKPNVRITGG